MAVSTELITKLRASAGAGMLAVKKALEDAGGDLDKAPELLRARGIDFVARNDLFKELARNLAMHIAMANPQYLRREDVPASVIEAERQALAAQAKEEGKPANVAEKIVEGRIGKFFSEIVLLEQPYIKDDKKTVEQLVKEGAATLGENIQVGRFSRIAVGE